MLLDSVEVLFERWYECRSLRSLEVQLGNVLKRDALQLRRGETAQMAEARRCRLDSEDLEIPFKNTC
jgi:hypothetical protein